MPAQVGAESGGHAGHDLEGNARRVQSFRLFAAAAEDKRIAAFEADHPFTLAGRVDQSAMDRLGAFRVARGQFGHGRAEPSAVPTSPRRG